MWNRDFADGPGNDPTISEQGELIGFGFPSKRSMEKVSFASGTKKKTTKKKKKKSGILASFDRYQDKKSKQKAADSKNTAAAIKAMNKPDAAIKLPPLPKDKKSKGMSTGLKIGIGVGAAALLGAAYYFLVYKKGKGK